MFVDKVKINTIAGSGGNGIVSFRREIYIANGGPDGGDGGNGGDVILVASSNKNTLGSFRYKKLLKADNGQNGGNAKKHGKSANNLVAEVPIGTMVMDEAGKVIADLVKNRQEIVVAKGGKGGFGNAHFTSSVRQAPRIAEKGEPGEKLDVILELRMIADVGLVGLPNAGKSSLLTAISNARPEIADYPFTTLSPHLGVVDIDKQSVLFADIPGLIKGASEGKGLGDDFLRHVSRCKILLHLIDVNSSDIAKDYLTIRSELSAYSKEMSKKPELVVLTKIETLDDDLEEIQKELLSAVLPKKAKFFYISSYAKKGLDNLLYAVKEEILKNDKKEKTKKTSKISKLPVIRLLNTDSHWSVKKTKAGFVVTGNKIERFAKRTDFISNHGIERLRDIMNKMGIMHELSRQGIQPEQTIIIGDPIIGKLQY
jgi:GTP-binding protein